MRFYKFESFSLSNSTPEKIKAQISEALSEHAANGWSVDKMTSHAVPGRAPGEYAEEIVCFLLVRTAG